LHAVLRYVLLVEDEIVEDAIIGISVELVASSRIDMLAGLSRW
jgi:hypothetical protein